MSTVVICSGGLDSVTLAYCVAHEKKLSAILSFDYQQRHIIELKYAKKCAQANHVPHHIVKMPDLADLLCGSALTHDEPMPHGYYTEQSMTKTIVPNRNTIMLSIAFGFAASHQLSQVAYAAHGGDHFIYPDCRPKFVNEFANMQKEALMGVAEIDLYAPFIHKEKRDIVELGTKLKVPFEDTWSCYEGESVHCGRCGTCVERQEAFSLAKVQDPTQYRDTIFWKTAKQNERS